MGKTQQILTRWNVQSDDVDTLGSQGLRVDSWLWQQLLLRPSEGDVVVVVVIWMMIVMMVVIWMMIVVMVVVTEDCHKDGDRHDKNSPHQIHD